MKKLLFLLSAVFITLAFSSCGSDDPDKIAARDREKILKYISDNDLEAQEHTSGLFYVIEREGNGTRPSLNSLVNIDYTGKLLGGKVFDSGIYYNYLGSSIQGWQLGIPLFRVGGKGKLIIPSALGYGPYATGKIPANSCLVFEVEIIDAN